MRYIDNPLYLYVVPSCATFALRRSCMVRVIARMPEHPFVPTLKGEQRSCNRCACAIPDKGLLLTVIVRIVLCIGDSLIKYKQRKAWKPMLVFRLLNKDCKVNIILSYNLMFYHQYATWTCMFGNELVWSSRKNVTWDSLGSGVNLAKDLQCCKHYAVRC